MRYDELTEKQVTALLRLYSLAPRNIYGTGSNDENDWVMVPKKQWDEFQKEVMACWKAGVK